MHWEHCAFIGSTAPQTELSRESCHRMGLYVRKADFSENYNVQQKVHKCQQCGKETVTYKALHTIAQGSEIIEGIKLHQSNNSHGHIVISFDGGGSNENGFRVGLSAFYIQCGRFKILDQRPVVNKGKYKIRTTVHPIGNR